MFRVALALVLTALMCVWGIVPSFSVYAQDVEGANAEQSVATEQNETGAGGAASDQKTDDGAADKGGDAAQQSSGGDAAASSGDETSGSADDQGEAAQSSDSSQSSNEDKQDTDAEQTQTDPVAAIGEDVYESLQEAVDAASDGDTIILLKDIRTNVNVAGKKLTIDIDGHTWTAKGGSNRFHARISGNSNVTLTNGTITGGRAKNGEKAAIHSDSSQLTLTNIKATGNNGEIIRNNEGTLRVSDCVFTKNTATSGDWHRYVIYSYGAKAKAEITNTSISNNDMLSGGAIYAYGDYYASRSKSELHLTSCDIKDNKVKGSNVYCTSNVRVYLNDTTISGNVSNSNDTSNTPGIRFDNCWIEWNDSAVYNNESPGAVYAKDIYVRADTIKGGSIPLPADMKDHGRALTNYKMYDYRYSYEFTEPITSSSSDRYSEIALEETEGTDDIAQYAGKGYKSVAQAVKAMDGKAGTVLILKDAAVSETIDAHEGLVIDLGGHNIKTKSTARSMFKVRGGSVTFRNGAMTGGQATVGSAINSENTNLTVENITFTDNENDTVYARFGIYEGTARKTVKVTGCTFTDNGSDENDYAINLSDCDVVVSNCMFDGNTGGIRMYEIGDDAQKVNMDISKCVFKNGTDTQLVSYIAEGSKATISDCDFTDNKMNSSDSVIAIEQKSYGEPRVGGTNIFRNCKITGNSGSKVTTVAAENGEITFENCLIAKNSARTVGAIEVDPLANLYLKNTVVKDNKITGRSNTASGGIALRSSYYTLITPSIGGSAGQSKNLGFYASSLLMTGGALYNNTNGASSPAAEDLFVSNGCKINLPEVDTMTDGDYDFSGLFWKDDNKTEVEVVPEANNDSRRYYSVGVPEGMKQVYVDGVNGDDSNPGTKLEPVKTLDTAVELAGIYRCRNILVLGTITIDPEKDNEEIALKAAALDDESEDTGDEAASSQEILETGDVMIRRAPGFTGVIIDVPQGVELTVCNTVLDGNSEVNATSKGSLIKVEEGGKLILDEGAVLQNNGYHTSYNNENGGGVYCLGDLVMNDGALVYHNYAITGGGICIDGGTFIMNGGTIDSNLALWRTGNDYNGSCGGGVALIKGAYMEMKGGTISNNQGLSDGGGISVGTNNAYSVKSRWAPNLGVSRLVMTGGTIEGNKAYSSGGGIFVQSSTEATIVKGTIRNNTAQGNLYGGGSGPSYFAGGGIYVNGYHETGSSAFGMENGKLYLTNVEIAENTANWEGGAIAVCGAGSGSINEVKGTVIYDNSSKGDGSSTRVKNGVGPGWDGNYEVLFDNVSFTFNYNSWSWNQAYEMDPLNNEAYMSEYMLNGASYHWMDSNGDEVSTEDLHHINKLTELNSDLTADDPEVKASVAKATVHITGNQSNSNGGGIGCNGIISIGQIPDYIDIDVEKKWNDVGHEGKRPDTIKLDLLRDGELYDSKTISADENGEWNTVFAELPEYRITKNGEQTKDKYEYTIEEDLSYVPAQKDDSIAMSYEPTYDKVDEKRWEITNAYTEVQHETIDPPTPEKEKPEVKGVTEDPKVITAETTVKGAEKNPTGTRTGDEAYIYVAAILIIIAAAAAFYVYRRRTSQSR